VVSFMSWPLYSQEKSPWYPLDRRLGGPQSPSGCGGEEKKSLFCSCRESTSVIQALTSPAAFAGSARVLMTRMSCLSLSSRPFGCVLSEHISQILGQN